MQALILAGGEGTRLRPLTSSVPKPVLSLANRPFISYMIDWLVSHGVDDVVMSCGFLADGVRSVLGDGDGRAHIRYVEEEEPLGTGGAVKHAEKFLDDRFLVLNGDILADFDLSALQRLHADRDAATTISLIPVEDPSAYGLVRVREDGEITAFLEKPKPEEIDTNLINAGAYVLEHRVLDMIEPGRAVSFEREVFPALIGSGLYGYQASGYWLDIGTPERYLEATRDILDGTVKTAVSATRNGAGVVPPSLVGERCLIDGSARVGPHSVLGGECQVAEQAVIEEAVLHAGVTVGPSAIVRGSIVGAGTSIGARSRVEAGAVIGAGVELPPESVLGDGDRVE